MAAKAKSVDKSKIIAKIVRTLKKEFGGLPKRQPTSVLETVIFGVCLENATYDQAARAYERLTNDFFDWNEVRVSTITELLPVFDGCPEPELKAHRVRSLLYYVFDHQYAYDFDALKKKSLELAQKQLSKIKHLSPFLRNYLLQQSLGTHTIPCDENMLNIVVYLGLLPFGANTDDAGELLKSYVRKADGFEFFWLLKNLSVISKANFFEDFNFENESDMSIEFAADRLADVMSGKAKRRASRLRAEAIKAAEKAAEEAKKAERAAKRKAQAEARAAAKAEEEAARQAEEERLAKEAEAAAKVKEAARKKRAAARKKAAKKTASRNATGGKKAASKKKPTAKKKAVKKKATKTKAAKKKAGKKKTTKKKR